MSIQSEAALRSGGTRGGRKQQTVSTGQSQTNIQIGGANAPAVGALAPLVMPVPNLESANTLTQAIAAVNGFGTTFRAVGQYVARDRATIEAQEFQDGGAMYEAWSTTRQKASLEKNYDANQRAALGDTNLFISGNINAALSGLPEGRAKTHFSALIAQSSAASLAPYANEKSTLDTAKAVNGFGQQQFSQITNGDDAKTRSASLGLAVTNIMNTGNPGVAKSPDDVAALLVENLIRQSASSGGIFETDIEPMLLDYPDLLRDSKIKHQALSQETRRRKDQLIINAVEDADKAGGTLLQRVDAMKTAGVPDEIVLEKIVSYTTAESAGNYDRSDLVDVSGNFSRLPEGHPLKAKWGVILDKGFENEQVSFAANLKTDYVNGKMSDLDFMNAVTSGVSKYDTSKSPGYQQSGAIDGDTFTKLLSLTTQNQVKRQKEAMVGQLLSRTLEATSSNMEAAGLDLSDISNPKLHQIAQQTGKYTKETSRALIVKASKGDAEAIKIISLASQSKVSLTADSGMNSEDVYMINWSNSMGSKFALDANGQVTPQSIQAYKEQAAFAASTPDIDILVDEARMEKANSKIRSGKNLTGKGTRTQIEERIRKQTDHAGKTKQNLFSGSDYENGLFSFMRNETDAGLTLANGQLMDEVLFEVTNHFNLSNSPEVDIDGDEMTKIIDDSIKKVAGDYSILRAGGRSVSLVRKDQLQLRLGRTESMLNAEVDRVLAEKGLKSEDVESMHPYGNDPATGEMTYTIRMKSPDGRFPMFVHFNMSGVEDVIPGVMSKDAADFFASRAAIDRFPETAKLTGMIVNQTKNPNDPMLFKDIVASRLNSDAFKSIINDPSGSYDEKMAKLDSLIGGMTTPSKMFLDIPDSATSEQILNGNRTTLKVAKDVAISVQEAFNYVMDHAVDFNGTLDSIASVPIIKDTLTRANRAFGQMNNWENAIPSDYRRRGIPISDAAIAPSNFGSETLNLIVNASEATSKAAMPIIKDTLTKANRALGQMQNVGDAIPEPYRTGRARSAEATGKLTRDLAMDFLEKFYEVSKDTATKANRALGQMENWQSAIPEPYRTGRARSAEAVGTLVRDAAGQVVDAAVPVIEDTATKANRALGQMNNVGDAIPEPYREAKFSSAPNFARGMDQLTEEVKASVEANLQAANVSFGKLVTAAMNTTKKDIDDSIRGVLYDYFGVK